MVKADVLDLSASKKAAVKAPKVSEPKMVEVVKPEPSTKVPKVVMKVVKPAEPKVEEVKVLPVPKVEALPPVVEEVKPKTKGARFVKGSDEAKQWAAKMREAKLSKKAQAGKEVLLEASD